MHRAGFVGLSVALAAMVPVAARVSPAGASGAPLSQVGAFSAPFEEPTGHDCSKAQDPAPQCKPAAMAIAVLPNGKLLYWDGLEGMNHVHYNVVAEFGNVAQNDQSRVFDPATMTWSVPTPATGGANPNGNDGGASYLPLVPHNNDVKSNDGDLFCTSLVQLPDGSLMTAGGTDYYLEPGVSGVPYGVTELEGLRVTHLFDPATQRWTMSGLMHFGRWYPSLVTLPNGKVFVASGVTKLIKPVYPSDPTDSGTNVRQTETYDPASGTWTYNGTAADKSLPLFPRLHLLPDGKIYYDAGGQTFNPDGQSYDEATWNEAALFDPAHPDKGWVNLGLPVIDGVPLGFRGSGFSVMLPLSPPYTTAQFLSAGGVIGVSPGTYVATNTSTLDTVDTALGDTFTSESTGPLNNRRWYSTGVVLPTGQVLAVNGADADEVVAPGSGHPVTQAELYDPATRTWTPVASEHHGRTYHNTAVLLPDGRVLVGGHAPIATGYVAQNDTGSNVLGLSKAESDPSFEFYSPPYLFAGPRPTISHVDATVGYDSELAIHTPDAEAVTTVALVRNASLTHLVDGDQRVVDLAVTGRTGDTLTVAVPGPNVVPPGPYLLFIMTKPGQLQVPSVARQVFVGVPAPAYLAGSPGDQGSGTDLGSSHGRGGARGHRGHHGAPTAASVRGSAPAAVVLGAAASSPRVRARAAASVQPVWGWLPVLPLVLAISWLGFGRLRRRRHRVAAR